MFIYISICSCIHIHKLICTHSIFISIYIENPEFIQMCPFPTRERRIPLLLPFHIVMKTMFFVKTYGVHFLTRPLPKTSLSSLDCPHPHVTGSFPCLGQPHGPSLHTVYALFSCSSITPHAIFPRHKDTVSSLWLYSDSHTQHTTTACLALLSTTAHIGPTQCHCTYSFRR